MYKKLLIFSLNKGSCIFVTSEFPSEIPRSQKTQLPIHKHVGNKLKKMRILKIYFLILILIVISACNNSKLSKEEIETNAKRITELLDENNIDVFRKWNFHYRGGEIWTKKIKDSIVYSCFYKKEKDTTTLISFNSFLKSKEFPCLIEIDTSKYHRIEFEKTENENIRIFANDNNGTDVLLMDNLKLNEVFGKRNPFIKIDSLSKLKDELKVYSIEHLERLGDFIQFYITYEDVLTYIPDYSKLNPSYNKVWIKEFSKGKKINENWNLRKLDKPKDNG